MISLPLTRRNQAPVGGPRRDAELAHALLPGSLFKVGAFSACDARVPRKPLEPLPLRQAGRSEGLKTPAIDAPGCAEKPTQGLNGQERFIGLLYDEGRARSCVFLKLGPE